MGFIGGMFGGHSGSNWKAQAAPILQGVDLGQVGNAYGAAQTGLQQQQQLLQALQAQQGIQNQSNVFNQQQALANQFQGVANGTGPNPALQQLQNTTGQNVANQAALQAGQRGSSANVGLMARQIGQQGAGIQQQAVGQGAALQAQQQLAAMQALQAQQNQMAGLATQQVGQQAGALQGYNAAAQNEQQALLGALGQYNAAQVGSTDSQNKANAAIQAHNAQAQSGLLGGLGNAVGMGLTGGALHFDQGGVVPGPRSHFGKSLLNASHGTVVPGKAEVSGDSLKNDKVPAMLSPKEIVLPRSVTLSDNAPEKAKNFVSAVLARHNMGKKS